MKYAEEILKDIENRGIIDTTDYLIDDGWEDYIRRRINMNPESIITRLDAIATERYPMITNLDVDALNDAKTIVDKYQKIQKIYETWLADGRMDTHKAISKISEVLCWENEDDD